MSIWFAAVINLNPDHVHPKMCPKQGILKIFKQQGLDFEAPFSEKSIKLITRGVYKISICNPDGYVDEIHNSLKLLVKQPFIQSIYISQHYYF